MKFNKEYLVFFLLPSLSLAKGPTAANANDPCANLLALLNRPTVADSVCSVKSGQVVVEAGYQYQRLYPEEGTGFNLPETQVRLGLPAGNEINVVVPNYINEHKAGETITGSAATTLGVKHQFQDQDKWIYAAESIITLPSGNDNFGSNATGIALNGIINYSASNTIAIAFMFGVTSQTVSYNEGGGRYNSFNPDLVLTWQPTNDLQFYAEVYGQTKTGPEQHDGFNADGGIQYLITEDIEIDIEYGHRLNGELEGFSHYFGAGGGIRF